MLTMHKDRILNEGDKVKVYFNLHKKLFSIVDIETGLVVGHANTVRLQDVTFKVSEKGRQRVLAEKQKNVHAYVVGTFIGLDRKRTDNKLVKYNPYKYDSFVDKEGNKVENAKFATMFGTQVMACEINSLEVNV